MASVFSPPATFQSFTSFTWPPPDAAVAPDNADLVWVGTGDPDLARYAYPGDGVYKSTDGGENWTRVGLEDSQHIGMITLDPRDSDVVYVAAQGPLWSGGGDRGLFKSTDGGKTWKNILSGGEYTGVNEVHLDPRDPDVIYAAKHQRLRTVAALINGGPESGIFKSSDGGQSWRELTNGIPAEDKGKIGLAISPIDSDVVYATIELGARKGGFKQAIGWPRQADIDNVHLRGDQPVQRPHEADRARHLAALAVVLEYRRRVDFGGRGKAPVFLRLGHQDGSDRGAVEIRDIGVGRDERAAVDPGLAQRGVGDVHAAVDHADTQ